MCAIQRFSFFWNMRNILDRRMFFYKTEWFKLLLIFSKNLFFVIILQLDLWAIDLVGDLTNYQENGEFKLEQVTAEKNCVYYSCCINPFPDLTYYIELRRRPMFYVFNLILPCVLINGIGTDSTHSKTSFLIRNIEHVHLKWFQLKILKER